jgi:hypothetical protein
MAWRVGKREAEAGFVRVVARTLGFISFLIRYIRIQRPLKPGPNVMGNETLESPS